MSDDIQRMNERLARMPQVMEQQVRQAMQASLLLIEADARRGSPHDTRRLAGSITSTIVGAFPHLEGRVGPSVRYGAPVEFGRRPGKRPPVEALLGWVRRHGLGGSTSIGIGGFRFKGKGQKRADIRARERQVAFLIARAIGRRGTRPQPYMEPALEKNRPAITRLFQRAGQRVLTSLTSRGT